MNRIIMLSFFLLLIPVSASAQFYSTPDDNVGLFISATTTSTGVVGGLVMLTVVESQRDPKKVTAFLKNNASRLRGALALGAGNVFYDFAKLLAIPKNEIPKFVSTLRKNRKYVSDFCKVDNVSEARSIELIAWIERNHSTQPSS